MVTSIIQKVVIQIIESGGRGRTFGIWRLFRSFQSVLSSESSVVTSGFNFTNISFNRKISKAFLILNVWCNCAKVNRNQLNFTMIRIDRLILASGGNVVTSGFLNVLHVCSIYERVDSLAFNT